MDGGLGWLYQGSWDAGYLLSHSSSSGTSTYTGSAPHTHTDVILHMESRITIACPQYVCVRICYCEACRGTIFWMCACVLLCICEHQTVATHSQMAII